MTSIQTTQYEDVDASPVKSFFVSMLTRDIKLEEAILDLLDNCIDGILRSGVGKDARPYEGFEASIEFNAQSFSISDNCGGIPWNLHERAFRMGRPPQRDQDDHGDQDGDGRPRRPRVCRRLRNWNETGDIQNGNALPYLDPKRR